MFDFQWYIRFPLMLTLSPQGRLQHQNLEINTIDNAEPCFPHDNIVGDHLCVECRKSKEPSVCHKLVSILMAARASLITDQKMSGLPIRAKYKHFKTICEHTLIILQLIQAPAPWLDDHPSKDLKLCTSALAFCVPIHNVSTQFWARPSMSQNNATVFAWRFSHPGSFSVAAAEIRDSNISLYSFFTDFVHFTFTLSTSQIHMVKKWCWFAKIHKFHQILPHWSHIPLSSSHFDVNNVNRQEQSLFPMNK